MKYTRRDFIKSSAALAVGFSAAAQTSSLETLSDWIKADRTARKRGLAQCLQRIRDLEPSIHAWVVVQPGQAAGARSASAIARSLEKGGVDAPSRKYPRCFERGGRA